MIDRAWCQSSPESGFPVSNAISCDTTSGPDRGPGEGSRETAATAFVTVRRLRRARMVELFPVGYQRLAASTVSSGTTRSGGTAYWPREVVRSQRALVSCRRWW